MSSCVYTQVINMKKTASVKSKKQIQTIPKERKARSCNIAHYISLADTVRAKTETPVAAVFHKSPYGFILVSLDCKYAPLMAWGNIHGITPIKCLTVSRPEMFREIFVKLNVDILYVNEVELLMPLPLSIKLNRYVNMSLIEQLTVIKKSKAVDNNETVAVDNDTNTLNKSPTQQPSVLDSNNIPSFAVMQYLEPTMTKQEYRTFRKQMLKVSQTK